MDSVLPCVSLKRSPNIRTRKDSTTIMLEPPSRSTSLSRRKTRPPPLQIIPELPENELDFGVFFSHSPATARPMQCTPRQSKIQSLSAYTFSIDDALLMFGSEVPRSPALSASSSTSGSASSEDIPPTPSASDDESAYGYALPTSRLRPRRITIRPLCISKTRSLLCQEDEDIRDRFEKVEERVISLPLIEELLGHSSEAKETIDVTHEAEQDFYAREFEDFVSLSPVFPSSSLSARRDSLILTAETLVTVIKAPDSKSRGRSRLSKPLPLLPSANPPTSSFPSIPTFPSVQTTARTSIVRRKRNVPTLPDHPPLLPAGSRPLPRVVVLSDVEDCISTEEDADASSHEPIFIEQVYEVEGDANLFSQSSVGCSSSANVHPLPPATPETPVVGMYGDVALPRASTDSDAPRSSVDSTSSFTPSASSDTSLSPSSFLDAFPSECCETDAMQRLRSRWSCSTLGSVNIEPVRTTTLLSPLRNVFGVRARRTPPHQKAAPRALPSKSPKIKNGSPKTPSPPNTSPKRIRREESRSSTSSERSSLAECDSREGSPSGLKRKPIPVAMFLRASG